MYILVHFFPLVSGAGIPLCARKEQANTTGPLAGRASLEHDPQK